MNLTKFSDYSLRMLIYLAIHPDRPVTIAEVGRAYGVSPHHLVKVAQRLIEKQVVRSVRGRNGGLLLAKTPEEINIGRIVRMTEPTWNLVECFNTETNTCPIESACGLKGPLRRAQKAFLDTLEEHTLADVVPPKPALIRLLNA